jgi:hypothetical protein
MPHVARVALDQERPVGRAPCALVEQLEQRSGVLAQRLAVQPQRSVAFAFGPDQVPAPSSTVPLMR